MINLNIKKHIRFLMEEEGSLKARVLRSGVWVTAASFFVRMIEFVRSIILARLLMPEVFGIMTIVILIYQALETFTQTGFSAAIVQRKIFNRETTDTSWVIAIIRGCVLALMLFIASPWIASFYGRPELTIYLKAICLGFLIQGFNNSNMVIYQKELNFRVLTLSNSIVTIVNFVTVVTLAYYLRSVWALIIGQLASYSCTLLISFIVQPKKPRLKFNMGIAKDLISFGKYLTGAAIVVFITLQIDNAVIGKVLGMEALGYYALAYTLANLPATHITHIVSSIMFPAYSKIQDDQHKLNQIYIQTVQAVTTLSVPAAAGIALLAPEIINTIYGEKWVAAVPALQILCIFGLIRSIGATTGPLLNAINKPQIPFYLNLTKLIIIASIIYPLTMKFGTVGTAAAIVLPSFFMQFVLWLTIKKMTNLNLYSLFKALSYSIISTGFMTFVIIYSKRINLLFSKGLNQLIFYILLGFVSYAIVALFFQRQSLINLVKKNEFK